MYFVLFTVLVKEGGPHGGMEFQLLVRHLRSGQRLYVCLGIDPSLEPARWNCIHVRMGLSPGLISDLRCPAA